MSIQLKKLKSEWIGYIFIGKIPIHAEIGDFDDVYLKIKIKHGQMSKRM